MKINYYLLHLSLLHVTNIEKQKDRQTKLDYGGLCPNYVARTYKLTCDICNEGQVKYPYCENFWAHNVVHK